MSTLDQSRVPQTRAHPTQRRSPHFHPPGANSFQAGSFAMPGYGGEPDITPGGSGPESFSTAGASGGQESDILSIDLDTRCSDHISAGLQPGRSAPIHQGSQEVGAFGKGEAENESYSLDMTFYGENSDGLGRRENYCDHMPTGHQVGGLGDKGPAFSSVPSLPAHPIPLSQSSNFSCGEDSPLRHPQPGSDIRQSDYFAGRSAPVKQESWEIEAYGSVEAEPVVRQYKRPADVLETKISVAEDDDVVITLELRPDQSFFEAQNTEVEDVSLERAAKQRRLYNEIGQSEIGWLLADTAHRHDDDDDDEEEEEEEEDEEEMVALDLAGSESGCFKFKASVIDGAVLPRNRLGSGGYGAVYKACINGVDVAVKILHSISAISSRNAHRFREFETEVDILGQIRHPNLVRLFGSCKKRRAIVYEYLSNGTLEERIQFHKKRFIWRERVKVAYNICEALVFLHSRVEPVAHGDLKPSNILFDSSDVVKLGDFGIARVLKKTSLSGTRIHVTTSPKGTYNYVDPEFRITRQLTAQSDTFAFGVILLQLVTGRTANDLLAFVHKRLECLPQFQGHNEIVMKSSLKEQKLIDTSLKEIFDGDDALDALELLDIGVQCCKKTRKERPSLVDVVLPKLKLFNEKLMSPQEQKGAEQIHKRM